MKSVAKAVLGLIILLNLLKLAAPIKCYVGGGPGGGSATAQFQSQQCPKDMDICLMMLFRDVSNFLSRFLSEIFAFLFSEAN
jgi:hypothetical protein